MSGELPVVVAAIPSEVQAVADTVAEAYAATATAAWLVPDPDRRTDVLRAHVAIMVEHAFDYGNVEVLADYSGVAVWFHYDGAPLPEPTGYDQRLAEAAGRHAERFRQLDDLRHANHPTTAHDHLAYLAVLPQWQHQGRAGVLLSHHHLSLDTAGLPGYLEAGAGRHELLEQHGYRPGPAFTLPEGPGFIPMLRQPRPVEVIDER